jgi:endonuclease/exonuclease/phosphatase family metal-dependent hydrolase
MNDPHHATARAIRVLTLNLWGLSGEWHRRRDALKEGLQTLRPDLVAFQEPVVTDDYDQVRDLLGADYHLVHTTDGLVSGSEHQGASIASRWPPALVREVDLQVTSRTADFPCTALIARVEVPDPIGTVLFVNHLPSWQPAFTHEREMQTVAVASVIETMATETASVPHVIVTGDLDATPESSSIRFWTGQQALHGMSVCYCDVWNAAHPTEPGHTLSPHNPLVPPRTRPQRIDYILVGTDRSGIPSLRVDGCTLAFDQPAAGVWATDHFGIVADFVP